VAAQAYRNNGVGGAPGGRLDAAPPLLAVEQLDVFYDQFRALSDVTLEVNAGEIVAIVGANGAGKSTLLTSIIGQSGSRSGGIALGGRDIMPLSTAEIIGSGVALVPEGRRLFPSLTVEENLVLGWEIGRRGGMTLDSLFEMFPILAEKRRQLASQLSGGQQQMVAFGRALLADPLLLLCDEISLGLAPKIVDEIYGHIPRIRDRGIAVVIVEQDVSRAVAIADRFYCLLEGEVSLTGRKDETSRDAITHAYFGAA
jgi:branched-chain amino acid transport system ATP-binding protein